MTPPEHLPPEQPTIRPTRPAARIVCLDDAGDVLLLLWLDRADARTRLEPPGGGIDPGEDAFAAAGRELHEETGMDPALVLPGSVPVMRDVTWQGTRWLGVEDFFLARVPGRAPALTPAALTAKEREDLQGWRWVPAGDLDVVAGPGEQLEPPDLDDVLARLLRAERERVAGG